MKTEHSSDSIITQWC